MLVSLEIRDLLIISKLELDFRSGLNVLTGETGAGKSILLDSLGFVLGWRGRAELVRAGAEQGEVVAVFDLPKGHAAHAVLEEAGLPCGDELILRRVNTREGRKTAWINDRRASGDVLRRLSQTLVELHGQHDDRGLLDPRGHRDLLDDFADAAELRVAVRTCWRTWRVAEKTLAEARAALAAMQAEEEFLRHAVGELDDLDPQPGEDEALDTRRRLMQGAEKLRDTLGRAHAALGPQGAEGPAGDALRWIDSVAGDVGDLLDAPSEALGRALSDLAEAQDGVARALEALEFNPHELESAEERLFAIRALARKHDVAPDDLAILAADLRGKLETLDAGAEGISAQEAAARQAQDAYLEAAKALGARRREAAQRLDRAVMTELAPLKMERAVFATQISETDAGPDGCDSVAFTVATNPGAPAGPLARIASGGELSRFLLALKMCLADEAGGVTMIFDEIDRGVGGATADAVGRRLARLADGGQVLVVTHSPQVAALGAHHWRVSKSVQDEVTTTDVTPLNAKARLDEIARMLSGDRISDEARGAAQALLDGRE